MQEQILLSVKSMKKFTGILVGVVRPNSVPVVLRLTSLNLGYRCTEAKFYFECYYCFRKLTKNHVLT